MNFIHDYDIATGDFMNLYSGAEAFEFTSGNSQQSMLDIKSRLAQSGTAGFDGIYFEMQEEALGSGLASGCDGNNYIRFAAVGGATEFKVDLDGSVYTYGANTQETNVIRKVVSLTGATDNVATEIFTVTTTDETGDVDGGAYSVSVHLLGTETVAAATAANCSAISLEAHWTRLMLAGGTGTTSAVAEISESAANDLGTGAITAITITTAETSEYVSSVLLDINTSGGTFDGYAIVELVYHGFTTAPIISD